jgi:hypothetical protein
MSENEVVTERTASIPLLPTRGRGKSQVRLPERRRTPRPRLAEIRRGASLNLFPPIVVTGAVRAIATPSSAISMNSLNSRAAPGSTS